MLLYNTCFAKNKKEIIPEILRLSLQYSDTPKNLETTLKYYFRNNSRLVTCFDKEKLIGCYLYTSGKHFFPINTNIKYILSVLYSYKLKSEECAVSIISLIDKSYPYAIYHEMNKLKVKDAKDNNFVCSIININSATNSDFCKMSEWSHKKDFFETLTGARIIETSFKNDNGELILIQYH